MHGLVSIIVPVYNVAPYLDRCVSSLIHQTYKNLEILLIDDGSTDHSGALCDAWQQRDPRIRVFHKSNGGLSDARNYGLEIAAGDYICFIDSDDWCDQRFVELMLGTLLATESDIVECDCVCISENETPPVEEPFPSDRLVFSGKECFLRFLTNDFFVSVCNKLYRRSILEGQRFRKGVYHEDEFFTYRLFSNARRACRISYPGYYYYQRENSIVHSKPTHKRLADAFDAARERLVFIEQHYPEYAALAYSKMMYICMYLFNVAGCSDISRKLALQEELLSCFRVNFVKYLKCRQYQKEMWRFCFFRLFPNRYCSLYY